MTSVTHATCIELPARLPVVAGGQLLQPTNSITELCCACSEARTWKSMCHQQLSSTSVHVRVMQRLSAASEYRACQPMLLHQVGCGATRGERVELDLFAEARPCTEGLVGVSNYRCWLVRAVGVEALTLPNTCQAHKRMSNDWGSLLLLLRRHSLQRRVHSDARE